MTEILDPDLTPDAPANGAATEAALGTLHSAVAVALTDVIANGETVVDKEGVVHRVTPSAAHIGAAIAFLKNNNITASPTTNAALADLNKTLNRKRRKGMDPKALAEAAEQFQALNGANGLPLQ